jgi:hypothetical protein
MAAAPFLLVLLFLVVGAAVVPVIIVVVMVIMLMVMIAAAIMSILLVIVAAASLFLVLVVMLVLVLSTAALMLIIIVVVVMVIVLMVVIVSAAAFLAIVVVMVVVVVAVAFHMLIDLVEQAAVVHSVVHDVLQLLLLDIEDSAHEGEIDLVGRLHVSVLLHTVAHVGEVVGCPAPVIEGDGAFDVAKHGACLLLDPFADLHHRIAKPGLGICVPASEPS